MILDEFRSVLSWTDLDRLTRTRTGYRYALRLDEPHPVRRFLKRHLSDRYGGEIHVEPGQRGIVEDLSRAHGAIIAPGRRLESRR